jgi:hypothetical protein
LFQLDLRLTSCLDCSQEHMLHWLGNETVGPSCHWCILCIIRIFCAAL